MQPKYDKLIVNDKIFTLEELEQTERIKKDSEVRTRRKVPGDSVEEATR